ncbi:hypothetical protein LEMLEM_LOCUS18739 [Lemmus lemmus]
MLGENVSIPTNAFQYRKVKLANLQVPSLKQHNRSCSENSHTTDYEPHERCWILLAHCSPAVCGLEVRSREECLR